MTQVWTFPPNWDDGVLETLEWLTAVLGSQTGVEQRIGRRQTPRRSFEAGFLVTERNRRYLDMFISSVGKDPFYLPIWHDIAVTTAPTAIGADFIAVDTQFREFVQDGFAYLRGTNALESEVVQIASVSAGGLQLTANTTKVWGKGTRIYPLILATLPSEVSVTKGTDEFVRFNVRFNSAQPNPFPAAATPTMYRDAPVLNTRPDESEDLTHTYLRLTAALDNETGIPVLYDKAGHGFRTQQYRWGVVGREAHQEMRSLFYYLSGKLKAVWIPTFMQDFKLKRDASPGDFGIIVENVGYSRFNLRLQPGMQDIRIEKRNRTYIYGRIIDALEVDEDTEALAIDLDLTDPLRVEDVLSISFMNLCRLDNDSIEINHPTDAEGLSQSTVVARTSPGIRQADPWTPIPFGDTVKNGMQALCDCLCSDFDIVDEYVRYKSADAGGEEYIVGRDQPPVGAGLEAWIQFYKNWPWVSPPQYTEASLRDYLDSFSGMTQAQARSVMGRIIISYLNDAEIAAMKPDAVDYSDFCENPGLPAPGPLQPRLEALKEAVVRTAFAEDLKLKYPLFNIRMVADIPAPDAGLLAEFCINPAPLLYEQFHRTTDHVTNIYGAGGLLAQIVAATPTAWPTDGAFPYPSGQRAKAVNFTQQVVSRLATSGINGSVIRPRAGGFPVFFMEGHESFQYAPFLACPTGQYPLDGSFGPDFWEEWSWFSMGAMIVDEPWPTDITVEVSRIAPFALINTVAYKTITRTIDSVDGGRYIVYWMKVNDREEQPNFFANPFFNSFEILPSGNTSYLVRIREAA